MTTVALTSTACIQGGSRGLSMMRVSASQLDRAAQAPCLDHVTRDHIGALLRAAYDEVAKQPIPNEHVDLLLALRHMERERRRELGNSARPSASDPTCLPDED